MNCLIGASDSRFPTGADVLDLRLEISEWVRHLKEPPAHWWPLCGAARADGTQLILHLEAGEFGTLTRGLERLARAFPAVRFIVDPFVAGKLSMWRAGVCLADEPNVWLTTRGLYASEQLWPDRSEREALYFTIGEVGAGKLLFASGLAAEQLDAQAIQPAEWLERIDFLDAAQRELILRANARAAFIMQDASSTEMKATDDSDDSRSGACED